MSSSRDVAQEEHVLQVSLGDYAVGLFVGLAAAHDEQPYIRPVPLEAAVGFEQVAQAFSLLQSTHEQDVRLAVDQVGEGSRVGEVPDVDAVGDDLVVAGEVLADEVTRGL